MRLKNIVLGNGLDETRFNEKGKKKKFRKSMLTNLTSKINGPLSFMAL